MSCDENLIGCCGFGKDVEVVLTVAIAADVAIAVNKLRLNQDLTKSNMLKQLAL